MGPVKVGYDPLVGPDSMIAQPTDKSPPEEGSSVEELDIHRREICVHTYQSMLNSYRRGITHELPMKGL